MSVLKSVMACQAVAYIVSTALGPVGLDKMLVDDIDDVTITNDGVTVLKILEVQHPAAKVLVELAELQDKEVGDGTTSVVIVAAELLKSRFVCTALQLTVFLNLSYMGPIWSNAGSKFFRLPPFKPLISQVEKLGKDSLVNCAKTSMPLKLIAADSDFFVNLVCNLTP